MFTFVEKEFKNRTHFEQVCAVKAPGFGENRKSGLQDLAVLTGGTVSLCQRITSFCDSVV